MFREKICKLCSPIIVRNVSRKSKHVDVCIQRKANVKKKIKNLYCHLSKNCRPPHISDAFRWLTSFCLKSFKTHKHKKNTFYMCHSGLILFLENGAQAHFYRVWLGKNIYVYSLTSHSSEIRYLCLTKCYYLLVCNAKFHFMLFYCIKRGISHL